MATTRQTMEDMKILRNAAAQLSRSEKRWELLILSLKTELNGIKKAHAKRDPTNAQDAVAWHMQENMITWLEVHIKMMENGAYNPPEEKEENKPGCFGAIGKPGKRKDPECPCGWKDRCKQSQEDS